jgi:Zn-dependent peptidase ImmA (M78 family)/transcriptional regulator with XRE-family HTH domain
MFMRNLSDRASPELALGERLRQARELSSFSQGEAAQALGITSAALSQYETGKRRIEALTLERIARLYGVPVTYFFTALDATNQQEQSDWETALRTMAKTLASVSKAGIAKLIRLIHVLEDLYRLTATPFLGMPHHPFAALPNQEYSDYQVAELAQKVRRHYNLGIAPLLNVKSFLDAQGYQVFAIPLGEGEEALSGLFFLHPYLGAIIVFNETQAYTRYPFTLSHEIAHSLFHWNRPAVLCRVSEQTSEPLEELADRFASYFLIPQEGLQERLEAMTIKTVKHPEEVIHIARYFGVSYKAAVHRLEADRKLGAYKDVFKGVKPVTLAKSLGYSPLPYEFGVRPLAPEDRLPRIFVELSYQALEKGVLSLRKVAENLGISDLELEDRLYGEVAEDSEEVYA